MKKLERGDVSVKFSTLYCQYCSAFRASPDRDIKKAIRLCSRTRKWISADTAACKKFRTSKYFWCELYSYWLTLNECENRRMSTHLKTLKCHGCKRQKFQIDRVIRYDEVKFAKIPKLKKLTRNPKSGKKLKKLIRKKKRVLRKLSKPVVEKRVLKRRTK